MVRFYSASSSSNQLLEIKMNIPFLFLIAGLVAIGTLITKERDTVDRWLCTKTPWYFRLWWCARWVRKDELHPALNSDMEAFRKKVNWERKKLVITTNLRLALRYKHATYTKGNLATRLTTLTRVLQEEYEQNLCKRRNIAHRRDTPSPSQ